MARFSKSPWRVVKNVRHGWDYEVRNGHRDPICVVYSSEADARLIAAAPNLLGALKHMVAIVRMHERYLRASEKAKYAAAQALVKEVEA